MKVSRIERAPYEVHSMSTDALSHLPEESGWGEDIGNGGCALTAERQEQGKVGLQGCG